MATVVNQQSIDDIKVLSELEPISSVEPNKMALASRCRCGHTDCPCFRMIYVSRLRFFSALQPNVFSDILQPALLNNRKDGVDGFLLFANGLFFQYLEGSEEALTNIKNRLLMDKRHDNIKLLSFREISERRLHQSPLWFVWLDKTELNKLMNTLSLSFTPYQWGNTEQLRVADALISSKNKYQAQSQHSLIYTRLRFLAIGNSANSVQHRLHYLLLLTIVIFSWIVFLLCVYLYVTV